MLMSRSKTVLLAFALAALTALPATAQTVTSRDIQRVQDAIYDASRDVAQARSRDASLGAALQTELDDARDEATYLKVKLRKNESVSHSDITDLQDRIEDIRTRARGDSNVRSTPAPQSSGTTVPVAQSETRTQPSGENDAEVGTEFDVRLQNSLSSATAQVEDRFEATTMVDLKQGDRVIVPAGSVMRGVISSVNKAGRVDRKGSLTVAFDQITVKGKTYPMRGTVTDALESEGIAGEKGKIGVGAGVGAIIGGILGGFKGALAGILIGGGGTIAATEGKDVELPSGTVLRVRLDAPLNLR